MDIISKIKELQSAVSLISDFYNEREQNSYKNFPSLIEDFINKIEGEQPTNSLYKHIPKGLYKPEQKMLQSYVRRCIELGRIDTEDYQSYQLYWDDKQTEEYFGCKPSYLYNGKEFTDREDIKQLIIYP